MHEIAESASSAFAHFVLTATCFPEVGDGREFGVNRQSVVPSVVQIRHGLGGVFFLTEFDIHVANLGGWKGKDGEKDGEKMGLRPGTRSGECGR